MNHWICIQLKGDRIYAGNPGYEDELGQHYEYDSFVGNHLQVAAGDILVLRDRSSVLGLGQVESIRSSNGTKRRFRCPTCGIPQIQARKKRQFRYRCADGHEFDHALEEAAPCTIFRAIFKQPFLSPTHPLEAKTVRIAELHPANQAAIARANLGVVIGPLRQSFSVIDLLLERASLAADLPADWATENLDDAAFQLSTLDSRERALREIRLRRGSRVFRERMIRRFHGSCAISGCRVIDLLEAAHIKPYRGTVDNHLSNGLLLRCDIHTLFDLNLLAIMPDELRVVVHSKLMASEYEKYDGQRLQLPKTVILARVPLEQRWKAFAALGTATAIPASKTPLNGA